MFGTCETFLEVMPYGIGSALHEWSSALCFWMSLTLIAFMLATLTPLLFFGAICIHLFLVVINGSLLRTHPGFGKFSEVEDKIIASSCRCSVTHVWKDICIDDLVDTQIRVNAHALMARRNSGRKAVPGATLLLIHGNGAGAISWTECFDTFSQSFDVIALDLPGFGRSRCSFRPLTPAQTLVFYVNFISAFLKAMCLGTVHVLGHSYGGFLSLHFARMFPEKVSHLILINAAGMLPTLGTTGAYWAFVFKTSLLQSGRWLGSIGVFVSFAWLSALQCDIHYFYWYRILSSPNGWGDRCLAEFITLTWTRAHWNLPALTHLCSMSQTVRISTLWGELDPIIACGQGKLLQDTYGFPSVVIPQVAHSPLHGSDARLFCETALAQFKCWVGGNTQQCQKLCLPSTSWEQRYFSTFSTEQTRRNIQRLYRDIRHKK